MPNQFVVSGSVVDSQGRVVNATTVRAYGRDLRNEQFLSEAETDRQGTFEITYSSEQFCRAEKGRADLVLRVFATNEMPLSIRGLEVDGQPRQDLAAPVFNMPPECAVSLLVEPLGTGEQSQYEEILAQVTPLLDGLDLADLTQADARFIVGDLELDAEHAP